MKYKNEQGQWVDIPSFKGESAYDIAVKNGYTGTESQWLESLKGEKGDKGDTGSAGSSTEIYATTETKIGTWLGKDLYRKVYTVTGFINGTKTVTIDIGINGRYVKKIDPRFIREINNISFTGNFLNQVSTYVSDTTLYIACTNVDLSNYTCYASIEYTKS